MESAKSSERRVVMAKLVATRWLEARVHPEYRMVVYYGAREVKGVTSLLRSFRDLKIKIGGITPIRDIGIREGFDSFTIWSSDSETMKKLATWFEEHGFETTGVW